MVQSSIAAEQTAERDRSGKLRIALMGATGAIGKEIMHFARQYAHKISEMILIVRRRLNEWKDADFAPIRLTFIIKDSFDEFSIDEEEILYGVDAFLCTIGSRSSGKDFRTVDYQYPLDFANMAKRLEIDHFGLLTASGANPNAWFQYCKVKGEVERDIKQLQLPQLTIFKPGLIKNRRNDFRFTECIANKIPFITKIEAEKLGHYILLHAIEMCTNSEFPRGDDNVIELNTDQIRDGLRDVLGQDGQFRLCFMFDETKRCEYLCLSCNKRS